MFQPIRSRFTDFSQYEDVTELLELGTQELGVGELLHNDSFNLMEAMSVIEILDPKMDSGMNWKISSNELSFLKYDITSPISTEQLLGIMDYLFCCEQTWYAGYGLSHTIYICHYVHQVSILPCLNTNNTTGINLLAILKAYVIATLHCSHLIWSEMIKGHVQDEEDFVTTRAGLPFYSDTSIQESKDLLVQATEWVKSFKPEPLWSDLLTRLEIRFNYLDALSSLSQSCCFKYSQAEKSLSNVCSLVPLLIFRSPPPSGAFEPHIIRTFNSNAPPRKVDILDLDLARSHFEKMLSELIFVCRCINYSTIWDLTYSLIDFSHQSASPIARSWLSSTIYQDQQSFGHFGSNPIGSDHIEALCPWTRTLYFQTDTLHVLTEFTKVFSQFILHFFLMLCRNRPRQRRTMCKLISSLNQLQLEASHISPFIQSRMENSNSSYNQSDLQFCSNVDYPSNSSWLENLLECSPNTKPVYFLTSHQFPCITLVALIEKHRLSLMLEILTSGFSLELYASHEYALVFHYISYVLDCQSRFYFSILGLNKDHQIDFFHWITERIQSDREVTLPSRIILELLQARLDLLLSSATFILLAILEQNGWQASPFPSAHLLTSKSQNGSAFEDFLKLQSDELRFNFRFSMFNNIQLPRPLQFEEVVQVNHNILQYPSEHLIKIVIKQLEMALELSSSLQALSNSHPSLFSAGMCPSVPSVKFTAIVDTIRANLTVCKQWTPGIQIQFCEPSKNHPPWVFKFTVQGSMSLNNLTK